MSDKRAEALASRRRPNFDFAIVRTGDYQVVLHQNLMGQSSGSDAQIMTHLELNAGQAAIMSFERSKAFSTLDIPQNHFPIPTRAYLHTHDQCMDKDKYVTKLVD